MVIIKKSSLKILKNISKSIHLTDIDIYNSNIYNKSQEGKTYFTKNESLKQVLTFLTQILEKKDFSEDKKIIQYLFKELEKMEQYLPTDNKLEELQEIVIDLEIKYDDFNDLGYYFDPLYVKIKKTIHEEKVKKIREENKRKRDGKKSKLL